MSRLYAEREEWNKANVMSYQNLNYCRNEETRFVISSLAIVTPEGIQSVRKSTATIIMLGECKSAQKQPIPYNRISC